MRTITSTQQGKGYSAVCLGPLDQLEGKTFLKEHLGTTSMELSAGSLAAGEALPFAHKHKQNEEVYLFLNGQGILTLDGTDVAVYAGSAVRIDPDVTRRLRNTGDSPLVYLCIQAKSGSLEQWVMTDGIVL